VAHDDFTFNELSQLSELLVDSHKLHARTNVRPKNPPIEKRVAGFENLMMAGCSLLIRRTSVLVSPFQNPSFVGRLKVRSIFFKRGLETLCTSDALPSQSMT
jgi:hypothetical protein